MEPSTQHNVYGRRGTWPHFTQPSINTNVSPAPALRPTSVNNYSASRDRCASWPSPLHGNGTASTTRSRRFSCPAPIRPRAVQATAKTSTFNTNTLGFNQMSLRSRRASIQSDARLSAFHTPVKRPFPSALASAPQPHMDTSSTMVKPNVKRMITPKTAVACASVMMTASPSPTALQVKQVVYKRAWKAKQSTSITHTHIHIHTYVPSLQTHISTLGCIQWNLIFVCVYSIS